MVILKWILMGVEVILMISDTYYGRPLKRYEEWNKWGPVTEMGPGHRNGASDRNGSCDRNCL